MTWVAPRDTGRGLLLLYGLASAILYCALLPLWEGFDELYHYGYVQTLAHSATLPEIGKSRLSMELWTSLDFAPASHWIQPYFERPSTSFREYFHLSADERRERRRALDGMDQTLRYQPSRRDNYEAKQSPLTYLLMAPIEWMMAARPLTQRVLALRLALSIATITLLWLGFGGLAARLGLKEPAQSAALFVLFSVQMVYAATCHIANDALLAPWLLFFLIALIDLCESPTARRAAIAGLLAAAGTLIKSSAVAFLPLLLATLLIAIRRRRNIQDALTMCAISFGALLAVAGPWFARNLILYHNLTASPETAGIGPAALLGALPRLPWRGTIALTLHSALWTGNSSMTTFSAFTINLALILFAVCALLWMRHIHKSRNEILVAMSIGFYGVALLLITFAYFISSSGGVIAPMAWYMEILLPPIIAGSFLALSRHGRAGQWMAVVVVVLWGYVAAVTWLGKLLPLYGGFEEQQVHAGKLWNWYWEQSSQRTSILSTLCPGPVWLIYLLLAIVLASMGLLIMRLIRMLLAQPESTNSATGKA